MFRVKWFERIALIILLLAGAFFEFAMSRNAFGMTDGPVAAKLFRTQISEIRVEADGYVSSLIRSGNGTWASKGELDRKVFSVLTSLTERQMVAHRVDKKSGESMLSERPLQLEAEFIGRNGRPVGQIMWLASKEPAQAGEDHGAGEVLLLKRQRDPNWYIVGGKVS